MALGQRSSIDKHQRIAAIVRLLSNGAKTSECVQYCTDSWGIGKRQAECYIKAAREIIIDDINQDRPVVVAELMSVCRNVIKHGMKTNNLHAVLGAVNQISKLGGLEMKP